MIECYINGRPSVDYGVYLDETALAALMTPAPNKEDITNTSRSEHGTRVKRDPSKVFKKERTVSLKIAVHAASKAEFYKIYARFCDEVLAFGEVDIETVYQPGVIYKCRYKSCESLTYYNGQLAKFTLTLTEPNPNDRRK
ncbi:MAG: hypothetical protein NC344_10210 [Bacteroidales bacterium]|nr:hypothetical protein [Bacteroidales bacterium]MCM1148177.1 hypothetical protein [Bacteroidales bacterium]MCM1207096.1 hypothetical protein [Bacillota bacterium]MCM1510848.1 hypothetical protein [Clostridium sp.]